MAKEYRVAVRRQDQPMRYRTYKTLAGAKRRMALYGPRPWEAFGEDPDDYGCCDGSDCGCGGFTVRQHHEDRRAGLPPLRMLLLQERDVSEWRASNAS